jgi:hypothetical protein
MKYYCTFGQNHTTLSGIPMKDYYLVYELNPPTIGSSTIEALAAGTVFQKWCTYFMGFPTKYSMIYPENKFDSCLFPKGDFYEILKETRKKNKLIAGIIGSLADNSKKYEKLEDSSCS